MEDNNRVGMFKRLEVKYDLDPKEIIVANFICSIIKNTERPGMCISENMFTELIECFIARTRICSSMQEFNTIVDNTTKGLILNEAFYTIKDANDVMRVYNNKSFINWDRIHLIDISKPYRTEINGVGVYEVKDAALYEITNMGFSLVVRLNGETYIIDLNNEDILEIFTSTERNVGKIILNKILNKGINSESIGDLTKNILSQVSKPQVND